VVNGAELVLAPAQWRIVAALAVRPSGLTVDDLLEVSGVASVGSMRTLVTGIRRQLEQHGVDGTTTLRFGQGHYRLHTATTDLDEVAIAVGRAASLVPAWTSVLEELRPIARSLTTAVSLAHLDDDDSVRSSQAERLRSDGLALLVEAELRAGSAAAALGILDGAELVELDERFGVLGAVADYLLGRQREALRRLSSLRRALLEELGQPPSRAAHDLEMAILRQDLGPAGWPEPDHTDTADERPLPLPVSVAAQRAMHGRATELAELDAAAGSGLACLVRISGPPGIGKSSLAAHWAAGRHAAGATVLWAQAGAGQSEYGVFAQLTEQLSGPTDTGFQSGLDAADALLGGLRHRPDVVLVVDQADELSPGETGALALLLGGRGARGPLTVLAESAGRPGTAFTELVIRESARGAARTLEVGPIDAAAVTELILARTGARDSHELRVLARELFDGSGGNPLYVLLAAENGQRSPDALAGLLDLSIDAVDPATLEVLELASVLGPRFEIAELSSVFGQPVDVLADALATASRHGLVVEVALGQFRFVYDALRRRVLERTGATRTAILHSRVSAALAASSDRTRLLRHSARALPVTGDHGRLAEAVTHARALVEAGEYREALQLAIAASQGAAAWPAATDSELVSVLAVHASALEHHGDRAGAKALHDQAWTLALRTGRDADLITAARAIGVTGESVIPDLEHEHRLSTALSRCASPADRSSLALRVAQLALNRGQVERAAELLDDAGTVEPLTTHTRLLVQRHVLDESPDLATRFTLSSGAARLAQEVGDTEALAVAAAYRSTDLFVSGRLAEAFESWNDEDRIAIGRPTPKERWFAAARQCFVSQVAGDDAEQSTAFADAALNLGLDLGYVDALAAYGVQVFCIRARHGGLQELIGVLEEQAGAPGAPAAWRLGLACAVLEAGDVSGATDLVLEGVSILRAGPSRFAAAGWLLAGRILVDLTDPPRETAEQTLVALTPWSGTLAVVGTSVGYLGPVDTVLAPLAATLEDPRVKEFHANARRMSNLLNAKPRGDDG